MEAINGVDREVENVLEKLAKFESKGDQSIQDILEKIREAKKEIEAGTTSSPLCPEDTLRLYKLVQEVKEASSKLSSSHRELHSSVSKVGKAIDRNFVQDFDSTSRQDVFAGQEEQKKLNQVVLQHFYRQGQLELGDVLAEEAGLNEEEDRPAKKPFQELNMIVEALHSKNLSPALEWAVKNRDELNERSNSVVVQSQRGLPVGQKHSLEMKLHKLQFIEILKSGNRTEAVAYARHFFPQFAPDHESEVQSLMGAVAYAGGEARLASSPYAHLLESGLWHEVCDLFVKDACSLMGLSVESPLSVVVNAGCTALPALLNIKQVMQQRHVSGVWSEKDELPIEIDLGPQCRFHSIFACPILRQQTTEENPPQRLACGHCISRDALYKLTQAGGQKLKCPYCPQEQSPLGSRRLIF